MLYKSQNDWIIIPWPPEHFYQIKKRDWGMLLKPFLDSSGVQLRFFYLLFRHCQDCTFESFFIEIITKCIRLSNLFLDTITINVKFKSPKSMARFTMINTMGDIELIRNTWMGPWMGAISELQDKLWQYVESTSCIPYFGIVP